jgi:flagellar motility protein MotE (MotC chaperone)
MQKFIDGIKTQAEDAQNQAEAELKEQEKLTAELTSLETEIERKENLISKAKDDFENLQSYKHFLDKFLNFGNSTWRPYRKEQKN